MKHGIMSDIVLTIAESDSGDAAVQADLKTCNALGMYSAKLANGFMPGTTQYRSPAILEPGGLIIALRDSIKVSIAVLADAMRSVVADIATPFPIDTARSRVVLAVNLASGMAADIFTQMAKRDNARCHQLIRSLYMHPLQQALMIFVLLIANPAIAADKMTVLLDWFVNPNHGPLIIAQEKGYFADAGLEVEIIAPADPSAPPKLVAAGQADIAISYQPQLHLQIHEGLPLKRIGTLIATPLNCLLVLDDGPIKTLADLKGRKIGFSVAGVEEALLATMLGRYDILIEDIELINVNFALSPALMSGQVDAIIGAFRNFELNQMDIENVKGRCFYIEEEGVPSYDELIYVANPAKMDKDKIVRFVHATELATQFIVNNPQKSWKIFSATSPELQDALNERAWIDTLPRFALRPAALDASRYSKFEAFLKASGLISSINKVSEIAIDITASN